MLDDETETVVPDQSQLDPSVLQLPPFEMIGGSPAVDFRSSQRRFFQYRYDLRLISEGAFGREVQLPPLTINYRIHSRTESIQSRDHQYVLPAESIRVLSLVPSDATDIRDRSIELFRDINARRYQASVLRLVAVGLFGVGAGLVLVALAQLAGDARKRSKEVAQGVSDRAILRSAADELIAVEFDRGANGWTQDNASRALAASRVIAAYALHRQVTQTGVALDATPQSGQFVVRDGWFRPRSTAISSGTTTDWFLAESGAKTSRNGSRPERFAQLQTALNSFAAAVYGREQAVDAARLDEAASVVREAARRLKRENTWIFRKLRSVSRSASRVAPGRLWQA
jgi:hypothetical protein